MVDSVVQSSCLGSKSFLFANITALLTVTLAPRQNRQNVGRADMFGDDEMPAKGCFKNRMALCHPDRIHMAFDLCEQCYRKYYRSKNSEHIKATLKAWHDANRERDRISNKEWKKNNPERHKELNRQYSQRNKEILKAKKKIHRDSNAELLLEKHRVYNANNQDKILAKHLKNKYKLSLDEYKDMVKLQKGFCAICGGTNEDARLFVDHDHVSGKIRGLLCKKCNSAIGLFRDDINILAKAIKYLRKHKP